MVQGVVVIGDATHNDRANGPEHLEHLRCRRSQPEGHDLAAVRRCICNENTPRNALENLGSHEDSHCVGKIEDKDERVQGHEATNSRPSVPNLTGDGPGEEDADEGTNWSHTLKRRLPRRCDEIFVFGGIVFAVVVRKSGEGNEISHQENAVGLHDLVMVRESPRDWTGVVGNLRWCMT